MYIRVNPLTLRTLLMTAEVVSREFHVANGKFLGCCQATSVTGHIEVVRGLTGVEGRLEGGEPVILKHVQECLFGIQLACRMRFQESNELTVFPALSRPRKRIFAFLCRRPSWARISQNQLRINIVGAVRVGRTGRVSEVGWMSCPVLKGRISQWLGCCHVELGGRARKIAKKKPNILCREGLTLIYLRKRRYPSS